MKKSLILIAVLMIAGTTLVFAEGTQEQAAPGTLQTEEITVQGSIQLQANDFPVLKSSQGEYELMYPRYYADQVEVRNGQSITVTGYEVPGPRWEQDEDEKYLRVTKAVIDGEEYEIPFGPGSFGGRGRMGGRFSRGGWGPEDCPAYGGPGQGFQGPSRGPGGRGMMGGGRGRW